MTSGSNSRFALYNAFNVSNISEINVTETDDSTESTTWDNKEIARIIHVIVRPTLIIIIFGTVGNIPSFYIMRRSSLKHLSTCFYMAILALADTGEQFSISIYAPSCAILQYHVFKIKFDSFITLNGTHSL